MLGERITIAATDESDRDHAAKRERRRRGTPAIKYR
jgi:hypothetical protein